MNLNLKTTCLYGIFKANSEKKKIRFDDSNLFPKEMQFGVLLKRLKIYFGKNTEEHKTLLGFESTYINYINGQKKDVEYKGATKNEEDIEIKELIIEQNDYIKFFEFDFEDYITYIKIISFKGKEIEFGERPEKVKVILDYEGDNMIQFFWGDYYDEYGITAIGFKYTTRKKFIFGTIMPILKLRYKLSHDEQFKKKYNDNYKELLKGNNSMIYLYKTCILPDTCFSRIIKYC